MAYQMLNPEQVTTPKKKGLSFMAEFNNKVKDIMNSEAGIQASEVSSTGESHLKTA